MAKKPAQTSTPNPFSGGGPAPVMTPEMTFKSIGNSGLRALSGWVREEFLPQLVGRQASRVYREMSDNDATVGAVLFAIGQSLRQIEWRVLPASDKPDAKEAADFVETLMDDMSHTWPDFVSEAQTKLTYGFAPFEICYKRRSGRQPALGPNGKRLPKSKFDDGKVGIAKLPLRGQDTVIKWFFDEDGDVQGMTQQPYVGPTVDIPIQKLLLLRPSAHKNNPEGRSILRNSYRPWYFLKRLEEQEAICLERMSGTPEYRVPNSLLVAAASNDPMAMQALEQFKKIITNLRIDEQMGLITPSDTFQNADGTMSAVPMYEFKYTVPQGSRSSVNFDPSISRYKLDIMTSVLSDFLVLGQSSRGTQSLADTKVDLFFQSQEGWAQSDADVLNDNLLPSIWEMNAFDPDLMPRWEPDMPQRVDLDGLSNFIFRLSQAGLSFADEDTQNYLREAAGMPDVSEKDLSNTDDGAQEGIQKGLVAAIAKRLIRGGYITDKPTRKRRR